MAGKGMKPAKALDLKKYRERYPLKGFKPKWMKELEAEKKKKSRQSK